VKTSTLRSSKFSERLYRAAALSSLEWPPLWRKIIYKLDVIDTAEGQRIYRVRPYNPDWLRCVDAGESNLTGVMPKPDQGSIDFDSLKDLNTWAIMVLNLE
jgi:hypothetical protein